MAGETTEAVLRRRLLLSTRLPGVGTAWEHPFAWDTAMEPPGRARGRAGSWRPAFRGDARRRSPGGARPADPRGGCAAVPAADRHREPGGVRRVGAALASRWCLESPAASINDAAEVAATLADLPTEPNAITAIKTPGWTSGNSYQESSCIRAMSRPETVCAGHPTGVSRGHVGISVGHGGGCCRGVYRAVARRSVVAHAGGAATQRALRPRGLGLHLRNLEKTRSFPRRSDRAPRLPR